MKKYKFGFCILHYYALEETINCIHSIKEKIKTSNYHIVIVDNHSLNGSGKVLQQKYKGDKNITVILNDKNLGFSGGNNIGFKKLKELNCDFIIMANNDILFLTNHFDDKIVEVYNQTHFAVMGPKIYNINKEATFSNNKPSIKKTKKSLKMLYISLCIAYLHLTKIILKLKSTPKRIDVKEANKEHKNAVLHGCCWIFSKEYIEKFEGIINKTFLYGEEDLLYIQCLKNKLLTLYN